MEHEQVSFIMSSISRRLSASVVTNKPYEVKFSGITNSDLNQLQEILINTDPSLKRIVLSSPEDVFQHRLELQNFQNSSGERQENLAIITTDQFEESIRADPNSDLLSTYYSFVSPYGDELGS